MCITTVILTHTVTRNNYVRISSLLLILIFTTSTSASLEAAFIKGSCSIQGMEATCTNEGLQVDISTYLNGYELNDPCIRCYCLNGIVSCIRKHCPSLSTCPSVMPLSSMPASPNPTSSNLSASTSNSSSVTTPSRPSFLDAEQADSCCPKCRSCFYAGALYEHEESWTSTQDACRQFTCKAGVITMARTRCDPAPCAHPVLVAGHCCPVCQIDHPQELIASSSSGNPMLSSSQRLSPSPQDKCQECTCDSNYCHCQRKLCPVLDCNEHESHVPDGACCPECNRHKTAVILSQGHCFFMDQPYAHRSSFRPDKCSLCRCEDGTIMCKRFVCPQLSCPVQRIYHVDGVCCPFCRDTDPLECDRAGVKLAHGSTWQDDSCTTCSCSNGAVECITKRCPHQMNSCPSGYEMKKAAGECCGVCEEKEATCSVRGDPTYVTFDGLSYNFQGTCKYTLMQTTVQTRNRVRSIAPDIRVIVKNGVGHGAKRNQTWTKAVHVHLIDPESNQKTRIVILPKMRVKINGQKVGRLPYIKLGQFVIHVDKGTGNLVLKVLTPSPFVLNTDCRGSVNVTIPVALKGRVGGLCGNYNGDTSDEFTTVEGLRTDHMYGWAQSWMFGSLKTCQLDVDRKYQRRLRRSRRRWLQNRQRQRQRQMNTTRSLPMKRYRSLAQLLNV